MSSAGQEAIELAATAGLELDPWQRLTLDDSLGERANGTWAAFEVGLLVGRQNGKGSVIEARELAGLHLFGEELITHTAHEFRTSKEAFRRILRLHEANPDLDRRIKRVSHTHGQEGIELHGGQRLLFATRTGGGGRGFSGDLVIFDEAYNLGDDHMAALLPTLAARPNPQVWYTTSAADKTLAPCEAISRVRRRALAGDTERLAYLEWSIDGCDEFCPKGCTQHDDPDDPVNWAKANPGLGIRLNMEFIASERTALGRREWLRERLGVGDYVADASSWKVISKERWEELIDARSAPLDPVAFAADITPERTSGSIGVAGLRSDGAMHLGVIDHRAGTGWMVKRLVELVEKWGPCAVVIDGRGPAASLIPDLEAEDVTVLKATSSDMAQACGALYDDLVNDRARHQNAAPLNAAVAAATKRKLGDSWAWARESTSADISPLVAVTLARWGHTIKAHEAPDEPEALQGSLMA